MSSLFNWRRDLDPGSPTFAILVQFEQAHLPLPELEFQFFPRRKWRFDLAWPTHMIAVEIEGLTREGGRHQRKKGYGDDLIKYRAAVRAGWRLLRYTPAEAKQGLVLHDFRGLVFWGRIDGTTR